MTLIYNYFLMSSVQQPQEHVVDKPALMAEAASVSQQRPIVLDHDFD